MSTRLGVLLLAAALVWVILAPAAPAVDLGEQVRGALGDTGASHPVTAVLLGFRAYDTLLEVTVVLAAVLAANAAAAGGAAARAAAHDDVLRASVNAQVPAALLVAGYFLWAGGTQPGGAFQAAAVLAAAAALLRMAGVLPPVDPQSVVVRLGLVVGVAALLAAFVGGVLPQVLLAVEALLTVSIALALYGLFAAARR